MELDYSYITTLVVDNEPAAVRGLKRTIEKLYPNMTVLTAKGSEEALKIFRENDVQIVLTDIEMPKFSGIELAQKIKLEKSDVNIIYVTAYSQYALKAFESRASGYILKPATDEMIMKEFNNLRYPVDLRKNNTDIFIKCFGKFEIFYKGEPIIFERRAALEVLAYLVSLNGSPANTNELCDALWEDNQEISDKKAYLRIIMTALKKTLNKYKISDIFIKKQNYFAIDKTKVDCDYFDFMEGKIYAVNAYKGEFMTQYSWAEMKIWQLNNYIEN